MLNVFGKLKKYVNYKEKSIVIDSFYSKLFYRITFALILSFIAVLCAQDFTGDKISCLSDQQKFKRAIENFCFVKSPFTIRKNKTSSKTPGIGPYFHNKVGIIHHKYYQWVYYVLLVQALLLYVPHVIWKNIEKGTIKAVLSGFEYSFLSFLEEEQELTEIKIPSGKEYKKLLWKRANYLGKYLKYYGLWGYAYVFFELLYIPLIALEVYLTDVFLSGHFLTLGLDVFQFGSDQLDFVFPKQAKCNFYKFGSSGTIQIHDALCVMPMNNVNQYIYLFLWFWFAFLAICTIMKIFWRICSCILYSRSMFFSKWVFYFVKLKKDDRDALISFTMNVSYSNWLFIYYIFRNMDLRVFRDLLRAIDRVLQMQRQLNDVSKSQPLFKGSDRGLTKSAGDRKLQGSRISNDPEIGSKDDKSGLEEILEKVHQFLGFSCDEKVPQTLSNRTDDGIGYPPDPIETHELMERTDLTVIHPNTPNQPQELLENENEPNGSEALLKRINAAHAEEPDDPQEPIINTELGVRYSNTSKQPQEPLENENEPNESEEHLDRINVGDAEKPNDSQENLVNRDLSVGDQNEPLESQQQSERIPSTDKHDMDQIKYCGVM